MNTAELKNQLHKLIVETDDFDILKKIQAYFSQLSNKEEDWWEDLSLEAKESIDRGLDDIKNGKLYSDSEVRQSIQNRILKAKKQ